MSSKSSIQPEKHKRHVLIVDDDIELAESLGDILSGRGHDVTITNTLKETLELDLFSFDVVLADIRLGQHNGFELIEALHQSREDLLCILMTAYAGLDTAVLALKHGAYDFLQKPLNIPNLLAVLEHAFDKLTLERAQQQTRQIIKQNEARLRTITENAPDLIVQLDRKGKILFSNGKAARQQAGHDFGELYTDTPREQLERHLHETFESHHVQTFELIQRQSEGTENYYSARMAPVLHEGRCESVILIVRDITAKKANEHERERLIAELAAKNYELERFTHTISHDLKSPLITIKGYLGFLQQALAGEDCCQAATETQRIGRAVEHMNDLLENLLKLSQAGKLIAAEQDVDMYGLSQEVVELISGRLQDHHTQVVISPKLSHVKGDRRRLLEVIQNLLENAIKFMGEQANPRIDIGMRREGHENIYFVHDNGIGIDPANQQRVFGLFDKLDQNSEGIGLGLSLVKRIIESHGGRIWIESAGLKAGTTFCFTLPQVESENNVTA